MPRRELIKQFKARDLASAFGIKRSEVREIRQEAEDAGFLDFVVNPRTKTAYFFVDELGRGAFGRVYTALRRDQNVLRNVFKVFAIDGDTLPDSTTTSGRKRTRRYTARELNTQSAMAEYRISRLIVRRLGEVFCETRVICAKEMFALSSLSRGFVRFPFASANSLLRYLFSVHHPKMRNVQQQINNAGYPGRKLVELLRLYPTLKNNFPPDEVAALYALLERSVEQYNSLVLNSMLMALQLTTTLGQLHSTDIFHRDIKPDNILVLDRTLTVNTDDDFDSLDVRVKLIDFGLGCALPTENDGQFANRRDDLIECSEEYFTTPLYRDPLARYQDTLYANSSLSDRDRIRERDGKFDVYAMGKTIMTIFDPQSLTPSGEPRYPIVRQTRFLPSDILTLLIGMTGEINYSTNRSAPDLSFGEQKLRIEGYMQRPTAQEAAKTIADYIKNSLVNSLLQLPAQ